MDKFFEPETTNCVGEREYYSFTWSIQHVFSKKIADICSKYFQLLNGSSFYATLNSSDNHITCFLSSTSSYLQCRISIYIGSKTLLLSNSVQKSTRHSEMMGIFHYHYDLVKLTAEDKCFQKIKQHLNETLVLIFRVIYCTGDSSTTTKDSLINLKTMGTALRNSSESLLKEKINLRAGDETETISKALLCARSPVFSKMFENDMKESNENTVTITDIKMPVLKVLVSYLYNGKLASNGNSNFDFICELYYAADKYDISDLRQLCVDLLLPQVSKENASRVMKLAIAHDDLVLKSSVTAWIATNMNEWVFTDYWKNMVNDQPKFAVDVLDYFDF